MTGKLLKTILMAMGLTALSATAYAQGFMVKPMKIELTARPGQTVEKALQLRNTTTRATETLMVVPRELGQGSSGAWQAIDPANEEVDTSALRSCLKWMELSADSVDIAPMQAENVMVRLKVPRGARGFYAAALLARSKPTTPKPEAGHIGIGIVIQFLIPVVVNIQGPPARERIELADVDMQYVEATEKRPATTRVSVEVANRGETYGRLGGKLTVLRQAGAHWQRVADATIPDRGIIPGVTITLTEDIERRLPSGRYKLQGTLRVGGRPKARINKEIDFKGDPTITTVAADVPLMLQPPTVTIQAVPRSRRSAVLTVQNPTAETVKVACGVAVPPGLGGVAMGSITGDDFTCAPWTEVNPQTFTIRGGGQRNIRITVKFPHMENAQPNYYADLHLQAAYPDGQSAGAMKAMIWVQNPKAKSEPQAQPMSLNLAQQEEDKYSVTARFGNVGNVHFTPAATATVATGIGSVVARAELETTARIVLPLGTPQFSGVLDFSKVEPGDYLLTAAMQYGEKQTATKMLPIKVTVEEERKIVTVVEATEAGETTPEQSTE